MSRLPLSFRLSRAIDRAQKRLAGMQAKRAATGAEVSVDEVRLMAELAEICAKLRRLVVAKEGAKP